MLATVVDTNELLLTVGASLVAGVGVAAIFSVVVFSATRTADLIRAERPLAAFAIGTVMVLAGLLTVASIVFGLIVMTEK
jgi:hypothetical protein